MTTTVIEQPTTTVTVVDDTISVVTVAAQGPEGIQGIQGIQGEQGIQGIQGPQGSVWYNDVGAPSAGLGVAGDYYVATDTHNWYEKTGSPATWVLLGNLNSISWGGIGGTLSDQTDLQAALDAKADVVGSPGVVPDSQISSSSITQHEADLTVTESQISDLQAYLLAASTNTLTNKTMDDFTNFIHADANHYQVQAVGDLVRGDIVAFDSFADPIIKVHKRASLSEPVIGMVWNDIANGTTGGIVVTGIMSDITKYNSTTITPGMIYYADGSGGLTANPTIAPNNVNQPIAFALKANPSKVTLLLNFSGANEAASGISYDNSTSGLTATNVKAAIDELNTSKEPADATILKDADIGTTVEAYDATILKSADIGTTVQGYDATNITGSSSIQDLSDVNTAMTPTEDQVMAYDATAGEWVARNRLTSVAWGDVTGTLSNQTDLQTALDNKSDITHTHALDDLSDVTAPTPSDGQALTWNNTSGYWEPTTVNSAVWGNISGTLSNQTDLQNALDNKSDVTHNHDGTYAPLVGSPAVVPDTNISSSSVTQYEGNLTITESQISDLQAYLTDITGQSIEDLSDVATMSPSTGQVLTWNGSAWNSQSVSAGDVAAIKYPVRVATTSNLSVTASGSGVGKSLTATSGGPIVVDGISLSSNDRVLVKNQTTQADNGIYNVTTVGQTGAYEVVDLTIYYGYNSSYWSAGRYFTISSPSTDYYVWTKLDGAGTDPTPGGYTSLGFVDIVNGDTYLDVAAKFQTFFDGTAPFTATISSNVVTITNVAYGNTTDPTEGNMYQATNILDIVSSTQGVDSIPYVLTRSTDFDQASEVVSNSLVMVHQGTVNADTGWMLNSANEPTIDTSPLPFVNVIRNDYISGVAWGDVTGTLSNQTDLQSALDGKADLSGGVVPDGEISSSSVTQHESLLTITESQISDLGTYAPLVGSPGVVPDSNISQSSVTQYQAALSITESQISDLQSYITGVAWGDITGTLSSQTDLQSALDGKASTTALASKADLVGSPGVVPDAQISSTSVTQHESLLTITESQISDLQSYLTDITGQSVGDLSDVTVSTPATRDALMYDGVSDFVNRPLVEADISDLGTYLTAETNDLTAAVTWTTVPDAYVSQSSVTQHEAALSITESQISDLGTYAPLVGSPAVVPDANISQSSVTQHQSALSITESQISDLGTYSDKHVSINSQTGTTYTLVAADDGKYVRMNNASAITLTVPPNSSVAFAIGTQILVRQVGAGQVTVAQGSGVTINTAETLKLAKQHSTATLIKVGTDEWDIIGDLELA